MERLEPVCIADGMYNGAATAEVVWKLLKELKNFQDQQWRNRYKQTYGPPGRREGSRGDGWRE